MSSTPDDPPPSVPAIEHVIEGRLRDIGGFVVRRALPAAVGRLVGPFIFFDHIGPAEFAPGTGVDVRPHPHIGLATITYLFEGEITHRDSLGSEQTIRPGDVNWMVAGRGIAHSERTGPEARARGSKLHGLQTWVALPLHDEETSPAFEHHPLATVPSVERPGAVLRIIAGTAYGARAPAGVRSPTLYVHARLAAGATLPVDDEHEQRALYVVTGSVTCAGRAFAPGAMAVLRPRASVAVYADAPADIVLVGGAPIEGPRHIWWNFVSSSEERIDQAKADWREGRFGRVRGDETEFIPLPEK